MLGVCFSQLSAADYFSVDWLKYVAANLLFLNFIHQDLPGLFSINNLNAVNGALWTLKIEVMFYVCVPLFVFMMRKFGRWQALLSLYAACVFPRLGNFGKYGDFSYGIYIVHFPFLQVLIQSGLFKYSPVIVLITASMLVLSASYLSWHFVEKRFLRKSSHYIDVNK